MGGNMKYRNIPVKGLYSRASIADAAAQYHTGGMENLRKLRKERGLTQAQLSDASGVSQGMIAKIETGAAHPSIPTIEALAGALRVRPAEMFAHTELQERVIAAFRAIDPSRQEAALVVLESMARK